jgi:hypothetical protein
MMFLFNIKTLSSLTHGWPALKFGADLRWIQNDFNYDFCTNGSFAFG